MGMTLNVRLLLLVALVSSLAGCWADYTECAASDPATLAKLPSRLSETGLFAAVASDTLGLGVRAYRPSFELWSDGAEKRRWIRLPEGEAIDTTDMDSWSFPVGTRVWKEFTRDGVRVETRMLERTGPADADWIGVAYVWNDAGDDAIATPLGAADSRGTAHDVPASSQCMACHGGRRSRVLGFSAIQLAHDAPVEEWNLSALAKAGALSRVPHEAPVVPGDATTREALGWLHANCGHCHNSARPAVEGPRCFDPRNDLDFWMRVDRLRTPEESPAMTSAVGSAIEPGDPDGSDVYRLATHRGGGLQMPPIASELVDPAARVTLRAWIESL